MSSISHASSIADLPSPVAVCCHDAGGANLIAAWVAAEPSRDILICAEGPARAIFAEIPPRRPILPLPEVLSRAACLLSGSGWASSLEHDARTAAKERGMPVLAVLDHWVNYRMRFARGGVETLPDALIVTDRDAEALALATFAPDCPVLMWENSYLRAEVAKVRNISRRGATVPPARMLVLLEPVRHDWIKNAAEPAEFRALDHLMENMAVFSPNPDDMAIRLRPHPSEPASKYRPWVLRQTRAGIETSVGASLAEDLAWADIAAGLESYALIVALKAGRRAVSYLPPGAPPCSLRHPELEHLRGREKMEP